MVTQDVSPSELLRRTFLYRVLAGEGARFGAVAGAAIAMDFGRALEEETGQARNLGIADLSSLARIGFKGAETIAWLRNQGVEIGDRNNEGWLQPGGELVARLADNEVLILGDLGAEGKLCERLGHGWSFDTAPRCYPVPRGESYAWVVVSGQNASAMLAKLCGVDLRPGKFAQRAVAQTSLARMTVIVIRHDLGATPAFCLLFDSASADYLWSCLRDAMSEFGGRPVGLGALRELA